MISSPLYFCYFLKMLFKLSPAETFDRQRNKAIKPDSSFCFIFFIFMVSINIDEEPADL